MRTALIALAALFSIPSVSIADEASDLARAHDLCMEHSRSPTLSQHSRWLEGYEKMCAAVQERWLESERGKQEAASEKRKADDDAFLKKFIGVK